MTKGPAVRPHDGERFWRRLRDAVAGSVVGAEAALRLLAVALLDTGPDLRNRAA